MKKIEEGTFAEVKKDGVYASFVFCGEGINGDFDPDNSDDQPLLRLDVAPMVDGKAAYDTTESACTQVDARTEKATLKKILEIICDRVAKTIAEGGSLRRFVERCSYLSEYDYSTAKGGIVNFASPLGENCEKYW